MDETSIYNHSTGENDNTSRVVTVNKQEVKDELLLIASRDGIEHIHPKTLELMEKFEIISLENGKINPQDITAFDIQNAAELEKHHIGTREILEKHVSSLEKKWHIYNWKSCKP